MVSYQLSWSDCEQFFLHSFLPSIFTQCILKRVLQPWVSLTETDNAQMAACCCLFPPLVHLFHILTPLFATRHMFTLNFVLLRLLLLPVNFGQVIFNKWIFFHRTLPDGPTKRSLGQLFSLAQNPWNNFGAEQCTKLSLQVVCSLFQLEVWGLVEGPCTILTAQLVLATPAMTKIIKGVALGRSRKICIVSTYYVFVLNFVLHTIKDIFLFLQCLYVRCSVFMCLVRISTFQKFLIDFKLWYALQSRTWILSQIYLLCFSYLKLWYLSTSVN